LKLTIICNKKISLEAVKLLGTAFFNQ
jgi:hypothetical protein